MMKRSLLGILAILGLVMLAACVPIRDAVQEAVRVIGQGDDGATLTIAIGGPVSFDPDAMAAEEVVLTVVGDELAESETACELVAPDAVECPHLGTIDGPLTLDITGRNRVVWVSYFRPGETRIRTFYVRESP